MKFDNRVSEVFFQRWISPTWTFQVRISKMSCPELNLQNPIFKIEFSAFIVRNWIIDLFDFRNWILKAACSKFNDQYWNFKIGFSELNFHILIFKISSNFEFVKSDFQLSFSEIACSKFNVQIEFSTLIVENWCLKIEFQNWIFKNEI